MILDKYNNTFNEFITKYEEIHINPWHSIQKEKLMKKKNELLTTMDVTDVYSFTYFMKYLIKLLCGTKDTHTIFDMTSRLPINFKIIENEVLINYPTNLKGNTLISINDIDIKTILNELDKVVSYGTLGKKQFELEKALFNELLLFSIPQFRNTNELIFKMKSPNNEIITKIFKKNEQYQESFNMNEYLYGNNNGTFKIVNNTLIYNHRSVQQEYESTIKESIEKLNKIDLTSINKIIIDLRGNLGGNSALNKPLMDFLSNHKDKELLTLTDRRIFSAGRYALIDLINLGSITIGEGIGTPLNCYGNSNRFTLNKYYTFVVSERYFDPTRKIEIKTKEEFKKIDKSLLEDIIFKPNYFVTQTKEDFINNKDTILDFALNQI